MRDLPSCAWIRPKRGPGSPGLAVVRLATAGADGRPHLVPCTFAVDGSGRVVIGIDNKPKSSGNLRRLRNIAENPRVSLLADHYSDDWAAAVVGSRRRAWRRLSCLAAEHAGALGTSSEQVPAVRCPGPGRPGDRGDGAVVVGMGLALTKGYLADEQPD